MPYDTEQDRNEGRSISLPRSMWDHLAKRARADGRNLSAYLRTVILDGLNVSGYPMPDSEEVEP